LSSGPSTALSGTNASKTIEAWICASDSTADQVALNYSGYDNSGATWNMFGIYGAKIGFQSGDTTDRTSGIIIPRVWVHYAAAYNSATTNLSVYTNGVLSTNVTRSVVGAQTNCLTVGVIHRDHLHSYFSGGVSEIRIWNFARTSNEISADYRVKLSGTEPGLVGYWPLYQMGDGSDIGPAQFSPSHSASFIGGF
jgi:hypothetical protein